VIFPGRCCSGSSQRLRWRRGDGGHRRRWLDWIKVFPRGYTPSMRRWSYDPGARKRPGPLRTEQPPDAEHGWSGPAPRLSAWLSRRSRSVHAAVGCRSSSTSEDAGTAEITSGWRSLRIWCSGPLRGHQKRHPGAGTATAPAPLPSLRPGSVDVRTPPDYDPARQDEQLHHEKNLHAPFVYFAPVGKRLGPH